MAFLDTDELKLELDQMEKDYAICGVVDKSGQVYPLGADTKALSTIVELIARALVAEVVAASGLRMVQPEVQNHYPDFTLMSDADDQSKIAVDVKTTYRDKPTDKFWYTLGGYTSFIRGENEKKNIVFSFTKYSEHPVIGFVYDRIAKKKSAVNKRLRVEELDNIDTPFTKVEVFLQEKWRMSSNRACSGNTTDIG